MRENFSGEASLQSKAASASINTCTVDDTPQDSESESAEASEMDEDDTKANTSQQGAQSGIDLTKERNIII